MDSKQDAVIIDLEKFEKGDVNFNLFDKSIFDIFIHSYFDFVFIEIQIFESNRRLHNIIRCLLSPPSLLGSFEVIPDVNLPSGVENVRHNYKVNSLNTSLLFIVFYFVKTKKPCDQSLRVFYHVVIIFVQDKF